MSDDSDCFLMEDEESDFSEEDDDAVVVVPKKKATTAKPRPLKPSSVSNVNGSASKKTSKGKKTVEETYQKLSQLEHILKRPDTYIGSILPSKERMFILQGDQIVEKEITFVPGLYKIFDEIVVNAADNKQRDPNMTKMEIDIQGNTISVKNNGTGIPVVIHKEHEVYVPSLIFGHLLTGSNFDDDEKKTTGGRNGYGAKLANVFSTEFVVECVDSAHKLKFRQVFRDNMSVAMEPEVKESGAKEKDYVKITFTPDLRRFQMDSLDEDTIGLFSKRAYDIAGTLANRGGKTLNVYLNGEKLAIKNFKDYVARYQDVQAPIAFISDERWEVGVGVSKDGTQQQVSFVNAIATSKGGRHVKYIVDQVADHLIKVILKKNKITIKRPQLGNHLSIMVNCLIDNPSFDSQTKDSLNTQPKKFGSAFVLPDAFLKKLEKSELYENIISYSQFRDKLNLKKQGGTKKKKLTGIAKLDDANNAGTAKSKDCTLIITEGDSAKSLAVAGLSVVGRDNYGVFPLKGKPLNVRDCASKDVAGNVEIKNLVDILGLKYGVVYTDTKNLRYGHLTIMADQDTDGSHIKGLVINFIHNFWPSLLEIPGFLQQFITPIVKVTKGKRSQSFFTLPEYEQWYEATGGHGYKIKYYKGLGTSSSAEAKEYFSDLDTHLINFATMGSDNPITVAEDQVIPECVRSSSDLIDMVFRKDRVEDRKTWLSNVPEGLFLDYTTAVSSSGIKFSEFFNKEYILFSDYDVHRSIPHLVDGLKPSQRKVLFGCFKRKLTKNEVKVAQLVGYIGEHSAYHHGEASLQSTIVNMAQNFVGSNNINLLTPSGQFGTRRMGGKDAASARYIFTKLEPIARTIFHPDDDDLLEYLNDDGASIEPKFYVPVIPMILCNGSEGIGTGWSCTVCNHNPREIVAKLRRKIHGDQEEEETPLSPFYSGFVGEIKREQKNKYTVRGIIDRVDDVTLHISELPLKKWTQNYKEFLEAMLVGDAKKPAEIKDVKENHTESTVSFTVTADKEKIDSWANDSKAKGLYGKFKLTANLSTSNMTMFNAQGRIERFESPEAVLDAFYDVRIEFYDKRKENLIEKLEFEKLTLSNKARFVEEVCSGELIVSNRKRKDILYELRDRNYDLITTKEKQADDDETDEDDQETDISGLAKGYEYLLGMKIWSLTFERAEELRRQLAEKSEELEILKGTTPSQLWLKDLDAIDEALDVRDEAIAGDKDDERRAQKKNQQRNKKIAAKKKSAASRKKAKKDEWDSEMEEDTDDDIVLDSDNDFPATMSKPDPKKKKAARQTTKPPVSVSKAPAVKAAKAKQSTKLVSKAPAVKAAEAKQITISVLEDPISVPPPSDSDEDNGMSFKDRVRGCIGKKNSAVDMDVDSDDEEVGAYVGTKGKSTKLNTASNKKTDYSKKRPSPRSDSDSDVMMMDSQKKPAAAKRRMTKKAPKSSTTAANSKPKPAKKKPTAKATTKSRKQKVLEDSDSGDEQFGLESSGSDEDVAPPARSSRRARTTKQPMYNVDDESDADDSVVELSDDDSNFD